MAQVEPRRAAEDGPAEAAVGGFGVVGTLVVDWLGLGEVVLGLVATSLISDAHKGMIKIRPGKGFGWADGGIIGREK